MQTELSTLSLQKHVFKWDHNSWFPFVFKPVLTSKAEQSVEDKISLHNCTVKQILFYLLCSLGYFT